MPLNAYSENITPVPQKVRYPFGPWDVKIIPFAAVMAVDVDNSSSLRLGTLTANATLNLTNIPTNLEVGTMIALVVPTAGTQLLTLGTGFLTTQNTLTGIAGATFNWMFAWNGTAFVPTAPSVRTV
jgi:hypothetical protein